MAVNKFEAVINSSNALRESRNKKSTVESKKITNEEDSYTQKLKEMGNKDLIQHFEMIILQNNGTRGKYVDMIRDIKKELLSRMK